MEREPSRPAGGTRTIEDEPAPPHAQDVLTNEEIEAILLAEEASPPQPDQPLPKLDVVKREPGTTRLSRWVMWLLIAFALVGGMRYWFDPAWKF